MCPFVYCCIDDLFYILALIPINYNFIAFRIVFTDEMLNISLSYCPCGLILSSFIYSQMLATPSHCHVTYPHRFTSTYPIDLCIYFNLRHRINKKRKRPGRNCPAVFLMLGKGNYWLLAATVSAFTLSSTCVVSADTTTESAVLVSV